MGTILLDDPMREALKRNKNSSELRRERKVRRFYYPEDADRVPCLKLSMFFRVIGGKKKRGKEIRKRQRSLGPNPLRGLATEMIVVVLGLRMALVLSKHLSPMASVWRPKKAPPNLIWANDTHSPRCSFL